MANACSNSQSTRLLSYTPSFRVGHRFTQCSPFSAINERLGAIGVEEELAVANPALFRISLFSSNSH
jgi:hypothetical protein